MGEPKPATGESDRICERCGSRIVWLCTNRECDHIAHAECPDPAAVETLCEQLEEASEYAHEREHDDDGDWSECMEPSCRADREAIEKVRGGAGRG